MSKNFFSRFSVGALFAGLMLALPLAQQSYAAALSISQSPLFITVSMPPNIVLLLDDSGSMTWAHVPDSLGDNAAARVLVVDTDSVIATPLTFTTTSVHITGPSHSKYTYSCTTTGYSLNPSSPTTGTSSTAAGYTCQKVTTYSYSCPSGDTQSSSWTSSGSTSTSYGSDVCTLSAYKSLSSVWTPDTYHYKSSAFNPLAYDPTQTYLPGYSDTATLLSTSFTAAYCNPYVTSQGTVNLSTGYQATVTYDPSTSCSSLMAATNSSSESTNDEVDSCNNFDTSGNCNDQFNAQAAFYYTYTPTAAAAVTNGCTSVTTDDACYTKVVVSATSGPGGTDERQNFANWWSFYRTRNLTTNTGANRAFTGLSGNFRVAWRDLNTMVSSTTSFKSGGIKDWAGNTFDNRIGVFTSTHRTKFFDWLERYPANNGTALRTALNTIGAYYQTAAGVSSPYAFDPAVESDTGTDSPEYVCRPNYAVVMTDGLWNDSSPGTLSPNNADNTALTLPDGTAFATSTHPYSDSSSNSLADIAFYYWAHSLRSDLGTSSSLQYMPYNKAVAITDSTNKTVSLQPYWNPQNDPADWPHMVTFTVSLGQTSVLTNPDWAGGTYAGGYSGLVTGTTSWPAVSSNSDANVYDLWHAAIDSRGQFFSADSPQDVAAAFSSIVNRIQGRVGSSSAIAVNSTRLDSNTFIYQAQFNSASWTGEVVAFPINTDGSVGSQVWAASTLIPAAASRTMYTWDETQNSGAGAGTTFTWANLNTTEKTALNTSMEGANDGLGSSRLSYLTGVQTSEQDNGGNFRNRASLLGDIVDSNPQYVGTQNYGFDQLPGAEGGTYDDFVGHKASRTAMLYLGANDGMMHAINATSGVEQFDYVPRGMYSTLSALTDPLYTHQFYVDGSAESADAYVSGTWKTLVVGTTGAGAREIFLLDVSSPSSFSASSILWDYDGTTKGDNSLGYTFGQATIARLHDGNWYVIFGNGFNSPNQTAVIYLYNIATGAITKFDTGVGSVSNPNGMAAPFAAVLSTLAGNSRIADTIYAGDLQGNVWVLDVSSTNASNWKYRTFGNGSTPTPLFTAKDSNNNVQPITDQVQVGLNSSGEVTVFFGTGTYFLTTDNTVGSNPPVMSFYGIIDDQGYTAADKVSRSKLLQQFIVGTDTVSGTTFRITTSYAMTPSNQGWFLDLNYTSAQGERVVSDPVIDNGRIIFTTLIPQGNACQYGGSSWLMELDDSSGAALSVSPFDTNGDGKINGNDFVTVTYTDPATGKSVTASVPVSGKESNVGIIKTPGIISAGNLEYKFYSGSTGTIGTTVESSNVVTGRLSWQQLQ
jgi:type IV pilus assembly protein PilY1